MTDQQKPMDHFRPDTLAYKLTTGDWSEMTLPEIAKALGYGEATVASTLQYVRKTTGSPVNYKKRRNRERRVIEEKPRTPTSAERGTALELEARRRGISYGQLSCNLSFVEEDRIVNAYIAQKRSIKKKKKQRCKGCSYRVHESCSFHLTGRLRRKDADGLCMEYTTEKRGRRCVV